jgi:hypothetical protein
MTSFPSRLGSHAKLLGRMIRVCGVDPAQFTHERQGLAFTTVARTCMACRHTETCRAWLDRAGPENLQEPPVFCPNAASFRRARAG